MVEKKIKLEKRKIKLENRERKKKERQEFEKKRKWVEYKKKRNNDIKEKLSIEKEEENIKKKWVCKENGKRDENITVTLVTICDYNYIHHFNNFVNSFILNEQNENVFYNHFYIYDGYDELKYFNEKFGYLKENERIIIHFVKYISMGFRSKGIDKKVFSGHYRFDAVAFLLKKFYNYICYMDVDSLINRSIYSKCTSLKYSFAVILRKNIENGDIVNITNTDIGLKYITENLVTDSVSGYVMSGFFLCKNDKNCKTIIKNILSLKEEGYKENVAKYKLCNSKENRRLVWFLDQRILGEIFKSYINKVDIYVLDKSLFDFSMNKDSYIFMSKASHRSSENKKMDEDGCLLTFKEKWEKITESNSEKVNKYKSQKILAKLN
tara:strand:- start:785 stop:1924 length:1140 start_codon:yes stop_codon:yes gene_type:complete